MIEGTPGMKWYLWYMWYNILKNSFLWYTLIIFFFFWGGGEGEGLWQKIQCKNTFDIIIPMCTFELHLVNKYKREELLFIIIFFQPFNCLYCYTEEQTKSVVPFTSYCSSAILCSCRDITLETSNRSLIWTIHHLYLLMLLVQRCEDTLGWLYHLTHDISVW